MENVRIKIPLNEVTAESINQLAAPWRTALGKSTAASVEYSDDLKHRKFELATQAHNIHGQILKLNGQQNALFDKINDLYSRGEFDAASKEEVQLEAVEKEIAALTKKLDIVSSTELKGTPYLYEAAKAAHEAAEAAKDACAEDLRATADILSEEIQRLKGLLNRACNIITGEMQYHPDDGFSRVHRHFHELDRHEREAAGRAKAECEAAAEARRKAPQVAAPPKEKAEQRIIEVRKGITQVLPISR